MLETTNKLFDYVRKWKYVETEYDPYYSLSHNTPVGNNRKKYEDLEKIYEWNYDNLRGNWNHVSKHTRKGRLCQSVEQHFFVFKRKTDAVAFKLQWGE